MARRSPKKYTPPPPFEAAFANINLMERVVVMRSVEPNFTAKDLLEYVYNPEVLRALRAAYPYTGERGSAFGLRTLDMYLLIKTEPLRILPPDTDLDYELQENSPHAENIMAAVKEVLHIQRRFERVRKVVHWLNDTRVTPGAARHYFPTLGSLLPSTHDFHKADGQRFKEAPIHEIANELREVPAIIAQGLLSDPNNWKRPEGDYVGELHVGGTLMHWLK